MIDKVSEAFSNAIKKANIFEKYLEIKRMCSGLIIFTTITGLTLLFYQSYNTCAIESIENKSYCIKYDIFILNKKIDKLIETNEKLYEIIIQNNKLSNKFIENQLLHICKANNIEIENFENNLIVENKEDDELLNECYDVIPCNNSKKVTGINNLFNWN
jgi:galactitol-specific phosphotransferase system IIB component